MKLEFKKASKYSRKDIGWVCFPDKGRPAGGDWDTGYVRVEDNLIIFIKINSENFDLSILKKIDKYSEITVKIQYKKGEKT